MIPKLSIHYFYTYALYLVIKHIFVSEALAKLTVWQPNGSSDSVPLQICCKSATVLFNSYFLMTDENMKFLSLLLCLSIQSLKSCFFGEPLLFLLSCSVALIISLSCGSQIGLWQNKRNSITKMHFVLTWRFSLNSSKYWQNMITHSVF